MGSYGIYMAISSIISAVIGGGVVNWFNIKANRKTALANADSVEIRNVSDITKQLIESTTEFDKKLDEYRKKLDEQDAELWNLRTTLNHILHLIEQITPENIDCIQKKIQKLSEK